MSVSRDTRASILALLLSVASGCLGIPGGMLPRVDSGAADAPRAADAAPTVAIDYGTHFVGRVPRGAHAFTDRVGRALARHPRFAAAAPGEGSAPLHLDFTLTNETNRFVAGLTGLACGLTFTLVPAYARDDFELVVELRAGGELRQRLQYRDAVTTVVHFIAVFTPRDSQPLHVVNDVVDNMLVHALRDLDVSGVAGAPSRRNERSLAAADTGTDGPTP